MKINFKTVKAQEQKRQRKIARLMVCNKLSDNEVAEQLKRSIKPFLSTPEWKSLRTKVLNHFGDKCMCCGTIPKRKVDVNVDHIKPRKLFPELALDFGNLQVLCADCNKKKGNKHMTDYRPKHLNLAAIA